MKFSLLRQLLLSVIAAFAFLPLTAAAAGTLTPLGSPEQAIQIRDHHVSVTIESGFARTEVSQTFFNPNAADLEAVYSFPVPRQGALSEFSMISGETRLDGEVLSKKQANEIYEEEKRKGNDAGVANKNAFETFEFKVYPVRAQQESRMSFVYYEPLEIDTGVGRYLYPLEDGGTDDAGKSFWLPNSKVENSFSGTINLRTAYPIDELRIPGYEAAAKIERIGQGEMKATIQSAGGNLNRDLLIYYRLAENLPGRIELVPYRPDAAKPGTFMLIATPGIDLGPITGGADYTFVLDVSGSMAAKIGTLARGVARALGELKPEDRFRVVVFSDQASMIVPWTTAAKQNVLQAVSTIEALRVNGSTNLYDGLQMGLSDLTADRVSSVILVTDGVTNTGIIDPKEFSVLMRKQDVRVFGFLMGNNSNWPLLDVITKASGGFYKGVSNDDDIIGQILLAKKKILSEALHDAKLSISGVKTFDTSGQLLGKVYRGEQVVMFGRYERGGPAKVRFEATISGEKKVYETTVDFPETDGTHPELERLWALDSIRHLQQAMNFGDLPVAEGDKSIESLGIQYQLVTDQTSMVLISDAAFAQRGIERRNRERSVREHQQQTVRLSQPPRNYRVDNNAPIFPGRSHTTSNGGGAIDPFSLLGFIGLAAGGALARRRRSEEEQ